MSPRGRTRKSSRSRKGSDQEILSQDPKCAVDRSQEYDVLDQQAQSWEDLGDSRTQEWVFTPLELVVARPGTHRSAAAKLREKTTMAGRHSSK